MQHNAAFLMRNVRSVNAKYAPSIKVTGNAKASTIREAKARKVVPPVVIYRGEAAIARLAECNQV